MQNLIKVGDIVQVDFNGAQITLAHAARVVYMPVATGDNWIFENVYTKAIHYVSEGCTVTKLYDGEIHVQEVE